LYSSNEIIVPVHSIIQILFEQVLGPFYVFQVFSMIVWFLYEYYYYATCIIIMSLLSLTSNVYQIRKNQKQLRDTIEAAETVNVCQDGENYEEIDSAELVPGDVITITEHGCTMQCDAVLISGNVIVNESMLTGNIHSYEY
jgi:cation-transporting P-type ATPase 13A2